MPPPPLGGGEAYPGLELVRFMRGKGGLEDKTAVLVQYHLLS